MKTNKINNENGSITTTFSMMISIILVLGIQEYQLEILKRVEDKLFLIGLILAAFFVITTVLMGLVDILSGEKNPSQMKRVIRKEMKKLILNLKQVKLKLSEMESSIKHTSSIMNPKGFEELNNTRSLVNSLESRIAKVNDLISKKDKEAIYYAYNEMFDDVSVCGDAMHGLITSDNNFYFSYDNIKKEFEKRLALISQYLPNVPTKRVRTSTAH